MTIYPAIDLKQGRCVRLRQGDMGKETRYSDDPPAMAKHWQSLGAEWLHVVDLDGAVQGRPQNFEHVASIVKNLSIPVQVGGGIRSIETIREYMSMGVARVVLGTVALEQPQLVADSCEEFPHKIVVGIDVKNGEIASHGWMNESGKTPEDILPIFSDYPLAGIVFTDISRDGMLDGPNIPALKHMTTLTKLPLIASGGVTKISDIAAIRNIYPEVSGVIIGKALYEGAIQFASALSAASGPSSQEASC
ncbi:MAG: 1-(5-phosphoribosyl)-5-[(5-phosphoribosylamino)methylideneamino]imidazole-4-carboxamide isomerase [Nitrospirales bacterium]|nr:1-(5-phosphoribosyl)-5-[(5-phosphoribosylamino)methylideneamino]imidazole-4-carboxamide isomerase [Nitrospira sp.]MDR4500282.1 1-(5-phosphoribosyl)-5-[(5-phosphoribosylamino)methylideneamino]imidazole-4-carboxamide isomerase [Nitrospirales bacterium]